jgi:hypothetical protein
MLVNMHNGVMAIAIHTRHRRSRLVIIVPLSKRYSNNFLHAALDAAQHAQ